MGKFGHLHKVTEKFFSYGSEKAESKDKAIVLRVTDEPRVSEKFGDEGKWEIPVEQFVPNRREDGWFTVNQKSLNLLIETAEELEIPDWYAVKWKTWRDRISQFKTVWHWELLDPAESKGSDKKEGDDLPF